MRGAYKIIGLLCLISLPFSCKKEFSDEFDPIIGRWKWYRTVKNQKDWSGGGIAYTEPYAWASSSSDQFAIEFKKKGLVLLYKNGKVDRKYKVKSSHGVKGHSIGVVYNYEIEFKKDERMGLTYFADYDTLTVGKFPYSTSDNNDFSYTNHFIRE